MSISEKSKYYLHIQLHNFGFGIAVRIAICIVVSDIANEPSKDLTLRNWEIPILLEREHIFMLEPIRCNSIHLV